MSSNILVTGGSGFIGSSFIRYGLKEIASLQQIVNLDLLTYAANTDNLLEVAHDERYTFVKGDIADQALVEKLCIEHQIDTIVHFAAETHVDRSIATPHLFYETNVGGTIALLDVIKRHPHIHFHHISTDEVFGSLSKEGKFSEISPYQPNSPYSASKAASDHFVRAYAHTYNLSTSISHCSNNYGPFQYVEKFIPRMIAGCLHKKPLPVYGTGENVRDWIFVDDHSKAVWMILKKKQPGLSYTIGGDCERKNIDLLHTIIDHFSLLKNESSDSYRKLITFTPDRKGHDLRYAVDSRKIQSEIGWSASHDFSSGIVKTITWYLKHPERLQLL